MGEVVSRSVELLPLGGELGLTPSARRALGIIARK